MYDRILHLLNKAGPHDPGDDGHTCVVSIPETENHRLMIESSRYLEALCMTWVLYGAATGARNHALKFLRK